MGLAGQRRAASRGRPVRRRLRVGCLLRAPVGDQVVDDARGGVVAAMAWRDRRADRPQS